MVYLLKEPRKNKLDDQYVGPYKVLEILSNHNVKLRITSFKSRIIHIDKIKIARRKKNQGPHSSTAPLQPEDQSLRRRR